mmetsp:Transcript_64608/g.114927  ORF Transcript_64608/g.114927 Transcript_64608/m.114927 type:complete len:185 (+) Transcript_64608:66-620(+)|eukprot:CAMPEP_0197648346 /NCGR_PEP_ID=MMETSP1338-20131121/27696_1 /TAXON_ID=43686 ORGANISM="Pelagodinium beii, Strain RCC1491" /NCGR_SAMPLE_ID=MMETSP1338 /ASSEMBLY_ACC=CAM_ASM_000754 /LENGTH=184 /DNA_ID=CAMNT_0043222325 /DNA_START=58 /DNA_END=612 /DNA_ORIENTATION=-
MGCSHGTFNGNTLDTLSVVPGGAAINRPQSIWQSRPVNVYQALQYRDLKPEDYELLAALDQNVQKRNVVNKDLLRHLPRGISSGSDSTAEGEDLPECQICMTTFDASSETRELFCGHEFCTECISQWLTKCKDSCPVCAEPVANYLAAAEAAENFPDDETTLEFGTQSRVSLPYKTSGVRWVEL